ncbi:MAG TPA: cold shock domain-containing protein [Vicinamibacterales bacterium]|nr:cold shock domain-containing protein [Vicinamibacterales bacterium]
MTTGTITRLMRDKGFGFIRDGAGVEYFFHRSSVQGEAFDTLREGEQVEFQPGRSDKGPRAEDVRQVGR